MRVLFEVLQRAVSSWSTSSQSFAPVQSYFADCLQQLKCKLRHPPGDEIYRDGNVSVWEVDGRKNKASRPVPTSEQCVLTCICFVDLLSESLSSSQDVSRSQDTLLRCRAFPILRDDRGRRARRPIRRLLLQRKAKSDQQRQLYHDTACSATQRLGQLAHRFQ